MKERISGTVVQFLDRGSYGNFIKVIYTKEQLREMASAMNLQLRYSGRNKTMYVDGKSNTGIQAFIRSFSFHTDLTLEPRAHAIKLPTTPF